MAIWKLELFKYNCGQYQSSKFIHNFQMGPRYLVNLIYFQLIKYLNGRNDFINY